MDLAKVSEEQARAIAQHEAQRDALAKRVAIATERVINNPYVPNDHKPYPKQVNFLGDLALEGFYGGAAGGGKSDALIMGGLMYVDVEGYAAIILRRTYPQLNEDGAIMDRAKKWLRGWPEIRWNASDHRFTFPSGATLSFGHMQHEDSYEKYLGPEFQYIAFDELTTFTAKQYRFMFSRLRRVKGLDVPLRIRGASNPGGPGHAWVKRRFIDTAGQYKDRFFVPATLDDNPSLNREEYIQSLSNLDPVTRARYLAGDWTAKEGGAKFKREWLLWVDDADIPDDAYFVRYWDIAATEPKKAGDDPDWTVGALVGEHEGVYYIADMKRIRANPRGTERFIQQTAYQDGDQIPVYMEQEPGASGKTVINHYARRVLVGFPFWGWHTQGKSKEQRFNPVSSAAEQGNVAMVRGRGWNDPVLDVLEAFPYGDHDDDADAISGAVAAINATPERDIDEDLAWVEEPLHEADMFR